MNFADNLRSLPNVEHILRLELLDAQGTFVCTLENKPGTAGSVAVYHAVSRPNGWLNWDAAQRALDLYAEHTAAARAQPGAHPNIDRLFEVIAQNTVLQVRTSHASANGIRGRSCHAGRLHCPST